jgi:hypothetical protein
MVQTGAQWLSLEQSANHMATKVCFATGACYGTSTEIPLATLLAIKEKSGAGYQRQWPAVLQRSDRAADVEAPGLPSVIFTLNGPLVYQWFFDGTTAGDR